MPLEIIVIALLFALSGAGLAWAIARTAMHVTYVTLADGRRQERSLPLLIRLLLPFASSVPKALTEHRFLDDSRRRVERKLVSAGYEGLIEASEIVALRVLMPGIVGGVFCLLLRLSFAHMPEWIGTALMERRFGLYFLILVMFGFYPDAWLRKAVRWRHHRIERALPFVLDLLTLSVESGLDFMTGINRIIQHREIDPLAEELIRVFREIQVGRSRRIALQNFSERVDHPDIRAVANALIQADELGTGIGGALRIQSDQIRVKRFQRAEKQGNEAPVKMLFPLAAFIFPSVLMMLLGPVVVRMMLQGGF